MSLRGVSVTGKRANSAGTADGDGVPAMSRFVAGCFQGLPNAE